MDGLVEATEFAEVFEVLVHLLVGDDGQGKIAGKSKLVELSISPDCFTPQYRIFVEILALFRVKLSKLGYPS